MTTKETIAFFKEHAGFSYDPKKETPEQGQDRCATELAEAESWFASRKGKVRWVADDDADRSFLEPGDRRTLYGYVASVPCCECGHPREASIWGIDLGKPGNKNDLNKRVVAAELALELMKEVES